MNRSEIDPGFTAFWKRFAVFPQASIAPEPGNGAFHDPSLGDDRTSNLIGRVRDDRNGDPIGRLRFVDQPCLVALVDPDGGQLWKGSAMIGQHPHDTFGIGAIGRMHQDAQQQAVRSNQRLARATRDPCSPQSRPRSLGTSVAFTVWLSRMAIDGVTARPRAVRTGSRRASFTATQVPLCIHMSKEERTVVQFRTSLGSIRQCAPVRSMDKSACNTARRSTVGGRPVGARASKTARTNSHCASVRSVG